MADNIIDISDRLAELQGDTFAARLLAGSRSLFQEAFELLAEEHGLSGEWVVSKVDAAMGVIEELAARPSYNTNLELPADTPAEVVEASRQTVEESVRHLHEEIMQVALNAFCRQLVTLVMPPR